MSYNQLTIFHPAIARINGRNIQATNRSTYLQNPANNYWYLLESLNASGEKSIETQSIRNSNEPILNLDEFFAYNEISRVASPIFHASTFLSCSGAASHDTFYATKSPNGEYIDICAVKSWVDTKGNLPVVTIKVLPNGKIVELPHNFVPSLPFIQAISPYDDDTLLANLNLAEQALRSDSPDIALALHRLMVNICHQSFGEHVPNLSQMLTDILMGEEVINADIEVSYSEIKMLSDYRKICGGWWYWGNSYNGRVVPYFEYVSIRQ